MLQKIQRSQFTNKNESLIDCSRTAHFYTTVFYSDKYVKHGKYYNTSIIINSNDVILLLLSVQIFFIGCDSYSHVRFNNI